MNQLENELRKLIKKRSKDGYWMITSSLSTDPRDSFINDIMGVIEDMKKSFPNFDNIIKKFEKNNWLPNEFESVALPFSRDAIFWYTRWLKDWSTKK